MRRLGPHLVAVAALIVAGSAAAAPSPFSGFWQASGPPHAAAPAALTRAGAAAKAKLKTKGAADAEALRWCVPQGLPYLMQDAGPLDIIVGTHEFLINAEKVTLPRHIYTGGQRHPDPAVFDNTPFGHSIGHWEGADTLSVDTIGLNDGVGPAGAPRTEKAHIVERFKVADDTLTVATTWTDPKVFARPYRFTQTYHRLPADYAAQENYCDPRDNGVGHH